MKTLVTASLAVLLVVATAPAQVSGKGSKTLLRVKWEKGKKYRYAINVAALVPGSKRPMNNPMSLDMDVVDAKAGVGTVKYVLNTGTDKSATSETAKVDNLGRASSKSSLAGLLVPFPEKALAVGDTWRATQSGTQSVYGKADVGMTLTFRGVKTIKKVKLAEINVATTITGASTKGKGTGVLYVQVTDGMIASFDQALTVQTKMTDSKGKTQTMDLPIKVSVSLQ